MNRSSGGSGGSGGRSSGGSSGGGSSSSSGGRTSGGSGSRLGSAWRNNRNSGGAQPYQGYPGDMNAGIPPRINRSWRYGSRHYTNNNYYNENYCPPPEGQYQQGPNGYYPPPPEGQYQAGPNGYYPPPPEGQYQAGPNGYYPPPPTMGPPPVRKPKDIKKIVSIVILCFCVLSVIAEFYDYSRITPSTHTRKPLSIGAVADLGYLTDETGWIDNKTTLVDGLKKFYKETGVQPYVYVINTVNGSQNPTPQQLDDFANGLYDKLFTDEDHLLFVFFYSDNSYLDRYVCGKQAATVIDDEAAKILLDYVGEYYSFSSYTNSEFLSEAFTSTAGRIMTGSVSPWFTLVVCSIISAVVIILYVRRVKKAKRAQEDQQTEEMLKIPLEKFGDPEAEELAKKYEDPPQQ